MFQKCPGRLLNVLCTFNLRHVPDGLSLKVEYLNVKKKNFSKSI